MCVSRATDRKSTRLNSSHANISYAVFCLKKNKRKRNQTISPMARRTRCPGRRQRGPRVRICCDTDGDTLVSLIDGGTKKSEFFFNDTATTEIYTLSLHDALPI